MKRLAFVLIFLAACGGDQHGSVSFKDFLITRSPSELPGGIPAAFKYPGSVSVLSAAYEPEAFTGSSEGVIEMRSADPAKKIEAYYTEAFKENGWKIIQSKQGSAEVLLMAESAYNEIITVILRSDKETVIRVYVKRMGRDA